MKINDCLLTKIDIIDDDHTLLMNLLNEVLDIPVVDMPAFAEKICQAIDEHSTHEEHLMLDSDYDQVQFILHLADHHERFTKMKEDVRLFKIEEAKQAMVEHIKKYDLPLGAWLRAKPNPEGRGGSWGM